MAHTGNANRQAQGGANRQRRQAPGQPAYKLEVVIGDLNEVFPRIGAPPNFKTPRDPSADDGVRRRLQALGFLYERLNSPAINAVATAAWAHFKVVINEQDDAKAIALLVAFIHGELVLPGAVPLPHKQGPPEDWGQFREIIVPGGYCVTPAHGLTFFGDPLRAAPPTSARYHQEKDMWQDNPSLGLVPFIATLSDSTGARVAGHIVMELVEPVGAEHTPGAQLPPALRAQPPQLLAAGPIKAAHPSTYVGSSAVLGVDPFVLNITSALGGKSTARGTFAERLTSVLLITDEVAGFHDRANVPPAPGEPAAHYNAARAAAGQYAVEADINADGRAAFILMPSWIGGDRYCLQFKAYVNNKEVATVETGTFVVWRNLRFSQYLRWPYPVMTDDALRTWVNSVVQELVAIHADPARALIVRMIISPLLFATLDRLRLAQAQVAAADRAKLEALAQDAYAIYVDYQTWTFNNPGNPVMRLPALANDLGKFVKIRCLGDLQNIDVRDVVAREYEKSYMKVSFDPDATVAKTISDEEWREAIRYGRDQVQNSLNPRALVTYDCRALFATDEHVVDGETIAVIAALYGVTWEEIWDHDANAVLNQDVNHVRRTRPATAAGVPQLPAGTKLRIPQRSPTAGFIPFREVADYNNPNLRRASVGRQASGDLPPNPAVEMGALLTLMCEHVMRYFASRTPGGLTIIQAPALGSPLADYVTPMFVYPFNISGLAETSRGCYVVYGETFYTNRVFGGPYSVHANTLHETGHVLYGAHQYTDAPTDADFRGHGLHSDVHNDHDYHDLCIMGYQRCKEDFCGRCVCNHMGWDTVAIPVNSP